MVAHGHLLPRLVIASVGGLVISSGCTRAEPRTTPPSPSAAPSATTTDASATGIAASASASPPAGSRCLGHAIEWTLAGGLVAEHDKHSIHDCRTHRVKLVSGRGAPRREKQCEHELLDVDAGVPSIEALRTALEDPAVTRAFAAGGIAGRAQSPHDGTDMYVTLDGKTLAIGAGAAPEVQQVRTLLAGLAAREAARCATTDAGRADTTR